MKKGEHVVNRGCLFCGKAVIAPLVQPPLGLCCGGCNTKYGLSKWVYEKFTKPWMKERDRLNYTDSSLLNAGEKVHKRELKMWADVFSERIEHIWSMQDY